MRRNEFVRIVLLLAITVSAQAVKFLILNDVHLDLWGDDQ